MSSSSDDDNIVDSTLPGGLLTPQNDTPAEDKANTPEEEKLVVVPEAEVGMTAGKKHLYSGKEGKRGQFQWQTKIPEDVGKPAEDADSLRYAILVRMVKVYGDPRRTLALHSIVIQSPLLKDLLEDVLSGYPGVTAKLDRLEFSGKFEPLIHRWATLKAAVEKLKDNVSKEPADERAVARVEHSEILLDLLETEFKDMIERSQDMIEQGVITHDLLWTAFHPGCLVYTKQQGQERILQLVSSRYGHDRSGSVTYCLNCQFVDFDGISFGMGKLNITVAAYEGTKHLSALAVMPLEQHDSKDSVKEKLIERGGQVENLIGCKFRAYSGIAWRIGCIGQIEKFTTKGRVVIDASGWNRFNPDDAVFLSPLTSLDDFDALGAEYDGIEEWRDATAKIEDNDSDDDLLGEGIASSDNEGARRTPLTDEQKMLCTPVLRGYSLKDKLWLNFFVNNLHDIEFNKKSFESLVLPEGKKDIILGFANTPVAYRHQFDDYVSGKGRGMIILLYGPPGTGKTLTAEGIAEEMETPLYVMSAGDLGLDPSSVETKLQAVLDMCTRWNAILLLDEADVFLEQRNLHELERNKLVTIFLRVLEYYSGLLVLTTNRVETFDPAFESRIHISIGYKDLDQTSRRTIWANFLKKHDETQAVANAKPPKSVTEGDDKAKEDHQKRTLPHKISESQIDALAKKALNGRQIKNMLKSAQLLALRRGEGLNKGHIETVLSCTQHLYDASKGKESTLGSIFH